MPDALTVHHPGTAPASPGQFRMWLLDQLGAPGAYNVLAAFEVRNVRVECLREALREVVERHEALRVTFVPARDGLLQTISPARYEFDVLELSGEERIPDALAPLLTRPFNLATGPLLRCAVLRDGSGRGVVALVVHHIAADGLSLELIAADFWRRYEHWCDYASSLPDDRDLPVRVEYLEYARLQQEWLQSDDCRDQLAYWQGHLAGAPAEVPLPTQLGVPSQRARGDALSFTVPSEIYMRLLEVGGWPGVTPFMLLLVLYAETLASIADVEDVVIAIPAPNRPTPELEQVVGYFTNTLPFRIRDVGRGTFEDVLERVRDDLLDAFSAQEVPFEVIADHVAAAHGRRSRQLTNVAFGCEFERMPIRSTAKRIDVETPVPVRFDLAALAVPTEMHASMTFYFDADLFGRDAVREWGRLFVAKAERAVQEAGLA